MDTDKVYFILGLVFSIPIGIGVNLISPSIHDFLIQWLVFSPTKKIRVIEDELARLAYLRDSEDKELEYKIAISVFLTILLTTIGGVFSIIAVTTSNINGFFLVEPKTHQYIQIIIWATSFLFFLIGIIICGNQLVLLSKIKDFPSYKAKMDNQIEKIRNKSLKLQIEAAFYGTDGITKDVTKTLNAKIRNNTLDVIVNKSNLGDPIKGKPKQLLVRYIYNGETKQIAINEGEKLTLP